MSTLKATIKRLSTGVPGMDAVLGGGLPEFSFNLLAGPPGCGKTTLAHQIMFSLATPERPALYFTILGEPPLKMLRYQQQFDFFDTEKVNRSIRFINLADDTAAGNLDRVLNRIEQEVQEHRPGIVVVDSFRSVTLASGTEGLGFNLLQLFIQRLGMLMTSWQATTFLIGEYFTDQDPNPVFTVSDGLIWLRQSVQRNSVIRKMEIMKMRGQPTLAGLHTFRITKAGVEVIAPVRPSLAPGMPVAAVGTDRLKMGIPALDDMMEGGLPRGYSLLVAGPSGSGKTILASNFLAEGARTGEAGIIASFEQGPRRSRERLLSQLVDSGAVTSIEPGVSDLSIDETTAVLLAEIRRRHATRVVIDSLSGFELALAPTFRDDFKESLARMVLALSATGATVLMTCELVDRYTDLRFSPYGTAFLTDAIIVQRYIEVDSRFERVMAVVKLRGSAHSNELRQFHIRDSSLFVGERLSGRSGLLGGQPSWDPPSGSPDLPHGV